MGTIYDVDYFIKKFEAIPEHMIIPFSQDDGCGNHCALGWCKNENGELGMSMAIRVIDEWYSKEANALELLLHQYGIISVNKPGARTGANIADLNNGEHPKYQQPTPKQRILAALYDIKAMQEPVKVVYKVVEVDRKVKQLVNEERILN